MCSFRTISQSFLQKKYACAQNFNPYTYYNIDGIKSRAIQNQSSDSQIYKYCHIYKEHFRNHIYK